MKISLKLTFATVAAAAFLFLGTNTANAQQKFGYINSQELMMSMPESDSVQIKAGELQKELGDTHTAMNTEFTTKMEAFQTGVNDLSETVRKQKEKELNDLRNRIEEFNQNANQELQSKHIELLKPVMEKAQAAIAKVAKEQGLAGIFDLSSNALAYYDESKMVNILPLVKKSLGIQ